MRLPAATAALSALLLALPAQAQRSASFQARTAGDLADLCAANPKEPLGDAKINFCHGFAQGAITVEQRHSEGKKPFCFPSSPPSRAATMGEFVNWVRALPEHKTPSAVDGFFQFLGERFPCK
jgi:Rap1a immunity proteins